MSEYEIEVHNLDHWSRTRIELETFQDANDNERAWLDRMVQRSRDRLAALGNVALTPVQFLTGEEGQYEK